MREMASRMKEDERNEKIIRGLLKLAENRRCINCNSLGPQYVCTNFWTFVCTTCSGIHREYTHRVKSVSMAKFTSQEVSALQGGGNERAREVYFKEWDPQRHSVPDSSNVERLRDFIRHVYVDKRYTGERSIDKPPRVKMGEKDDSYENRRVDTSRGDSRSPPYDDRYDRPYGDRSGLGGRNDGYRSNYDDTSPGHDQESRYGNNYRKSPVRFEVVDDRRREDRFGNGRKVEESKSEGRSPNRQTDTSSPPIVRPVRDILGDNVPPLRVGEPPKANGDKASDGFARTQRTASSSSLGSNDGGSVELKRENLGSLIDFNADPEPPAITSSPPAQLSTTPVAQPVTQATGPSVDGGNWASFEFAPQAPAQPHPHPPAQPQAPSGANTLESLLSQLSMPASAPVGNISARSSVAPAISPIDNLSMLPGSSGMTATVTNSSPPFTNSAVAATVGYVQSSSLSSSHAAAPTGMPSGMPFVDGSSSTKINGGGQWPNLQQNNSSLFRANDNQISVPQFMPVVQASSNQAWYSPRAHNAQAPSTTSAFSHSVSKQIQESSVPPAHSEAKTHERKALPEDLFAMTYPTGPVSVQGWHAGPPPGMGYGLQYPTAAPMHTFYQPSKPANPFDLSNEPTMVHAPSFPSMTSLQGTLPNMGASPGLVRSSSLGNPSQHWIPPQSQSYSSPGQQSPSYASAGQSPAYSSALPPSAYMGQPFSQNMPAPRNQASVGQGGEAVFFGNVSTNQQQAGRYSLPATPNPLSSGGNPFG